MKVILTDKVKSLGSAGEIVNVSEGYARNFLIPNRSAILADESNSKQMADYQKMLGKKVAQEKAQAEAIAKQVNEITLTLIKKVGGNGSLFGTVTANELSNALEEKGIAVEKRQINIDMPIKTLGEYEIKVKLFKDVETTLKIELKADEKQMAELKAKQEAMAESKRLRAEMAKEKEEAEKADSESGSEESSEVTDA